MTAEGISAVFGIVLSLFFSYIPGVKDWFDKQAPQVKRLIMAGGMLITAAAALGLSCANIIPGVECTQEGLLSLIGAYIAALVANQAAFVITKGSAA